MKKEGKEKRKEKECFVYYFKKTLLTNSCRSYQSRLRGRISVQSAELRIIIEIQFDLNREQ